MYTKITRSGGRSYLQLVEGFRNEEGKVRHRVVANLGRLEDLTPAKLDPLIKPREESGMSPEANELLAKLYKTGKHPAMQRDNQDKNPYCLIPQCSRELMWGVGKGAR